MKKGIIAIVALGLFVAIAFFFYPKEAPSLRYQTLEGQTIHSESLLGKVVLVKFWATSCATCVKQMPDTINYYETYRDQGYETIAVAMSYDDLKALERFKEKYQLPFPVAFDQSGELAKAFGGVRFTPIAFLMDRQGQIVKRYIGDYDKTEFIHTLEKTLAKKD